MEFEVLRAQPEDAQELIDYCKTIGGESDNLTFGSEGLPISVEQERVFLENMLRSEKDIYLVAKVNGYIVGAATLSAYQRARLAHRAEISLSVRKSMWGHHIGTRLLEEIIHFARETAQLEILSLEVRCDNARAISLYRKYGFESIGRFNGFMKIEGRYIDLELMRLQL